MSKQYLSYDADGKAVWSDKRQVRKEIPGTLNNALGCINTQVVAHAEHAKKHGFKVEFKEDPSVPGFYQCDTSGLSEKQKAKYIESRGLVDKNSRNGSGMVIDQGHLDQMRARILKQYPLSE